MKMFDFTYWFSSFFVVFDHVCILLVKTLQWAHVLVWRGSSRSTRPSEEDLRREESDQWDYPAIEGTIWIIPDQNDKTEPSPGGNPLLGLEGDDGLEIQALWLFIQKVWKPKEKSFVEQKQESSTIRSSIQTWTFSKTTSSPSQRNGSTIMYDSKHSWFQSQLDHGGQCDQHLLLPPPGLHPLLSLWTNGPRQ